MHERRIRAASHQSGVLSALSVGLSSTFSPKASDDPV
jgi:hypothetical protein